MYNLEISELKWKHRPGPTGDTCSITIKCVVPTITVTNVRVRSTDILEVASAINGNYIVNTSTIDIVGGVYTAELAGYVTNAQLEATLDGIDVMSVTAVSDEKVESDADPNIFVYHAIDQADPILGADMFANVASKYDMDTLPVGEPVLLDGQPSLYEAMPFYRIDTVTMDFLTATSAHRFVSVVKSDTGKLVQEIIDAGKYETRTVVSI